MDLTLTAVLCASSAVFDIAGRCRWRSSYCGGANVAVAWLLQFALADYTATRLVSSCLYSHVFLYTSTIHKSKHGNFSFSPLVCCYSRATCLSMSLDVTDDGLQGSAAARLGPILMPPGQKFDISSIDAAANLLSRLPHTFFWQSMDYQPLSVASAVTSQPSTGAKAGPSSEALYWRRFRNPTFIKEYAPISHIAFVPAANAFTTAALESSSGAADASASRIGGKTPVSAGFGASSQARARFAVTSGPRVQIYSARTNRVLKTITRFGDVARSAEIRADGRLIVAGDDGGKVQVFDINSRAILRSFQPHRLPAHVTHFSPQPTTILSASDDATVQLHDIPSSATLNKFTNHTDYVRSAVVSPDNPSLVLSGSYDQTVRLWDARTSEKGGEVMRMKHGAPVESTLVYPTGGGGVAVSAGGTVLRVWDLMMGGRGLKAVSNHQKTITSLALSLSTGAEGTLPGFGEAEEDGSAGGLRLLSAGIDGLVKVYDPVKDYKVVHTMRYPSPILTIAISPEERELAVGMADGTLCVRKREVKKSEEEARSLQRTALAGGGGVAGAGGLEAVLPFAGMEEGGAASRRDEAQAKRAALARHDDVRAESVRARRLKPYDRLLKGFRYSEALDAVLRPGIPAPVTFSLLVELKRRGGGGGQDARDSVTAADGLARAVGGRDDVGLEPLLKFLLRHASNPQWADIVCDTMEVVLDVYSSTLGLSPLTDALFSRLWAKVSDEVKLQRQVEVVRGGLEMLLHRSLIGR